MQLKKQVMPSLSVLQLMQDDQVLQDKTALNPDRVAELLWRLETCLSSIYFSYGGAVYEQQEGKAMGLPVSAAVANHYMRVL